MKICIHRGANEIGGTCIEIESQGKRLVLDIGQPLDCEDPDTLPLYPIPGFDKPDPSLLGVVISHPHQDHYGLAYRLPPETPILMGKAAQAILEAAAVFSPAGATFGNVTHLQDRTPIILGPFTITPFLVDHSAYDAYAIQVENDGKSLFYTGDLRAHGRKAKLFHKLLRQPPKHVDVLLMEGTTLGRPEETFPTETALEHRFVELFDDTTGMPLVWCSGQNIDRLVTIYRACKRTGRQFIIDMYTAHVLRATGNPNLPQAGWDGVKVFLPWYQKRKIIRDQSFEVAKSYKPYRIYEEQLATAATRSVMLFRPSMIRDVEQVNCLTGARLIYSMWAGYLTDRQQEPFQNWLDHIMIPLDTCHTSGHAGVADLLTLRKGFPRARLVLVHTEMPERAVNTFDNVLKLGDGEWWEMPNG